MSPSHISLASGFFLAGKFSEVYGYSVVNVWEREMGKRIRTLLIPLLIWPMIGMLWSAPFIIIANRIAGRPIEHHVLILNGVLWPGVGILWFIRFLLILVFLSPVLLLLVRKAGRMWLIFAFVAYWSILTFLDPVKPTGPLYWCVYSFSLEGLAYFSAGLYLRQNDDVVLNMRRKYIARTLLPVGVFLLVVSVAYRRVAICGGELNLRHFPLPFLMAGMFGVMPTKRLPGGLTTAAFPVYLMHGLWVVPIGCFLNQLPFVPALIHYLIKWFGAFVCSVGSAWALRKFAPKVAYVLLGGR